MEMNTQFIDSIKHALIFSPEMVSSFIMLFAVTRHLVGNLNGLSKPDLFKWVSNIINEYWPSSVTTVPFLSIEQTLDIFSKLELLSLTEIQGFLVLIKLYLLNLDKITQLLEFHIPTMAPGVINIVFQNLTGILQIHDFLFKFINEFLIPFGAHYAHVDFISVFDYSSLIDPSFDTLSGHWSGCGKTLAKLYRTIENAQSLKGIEKLSFEL